MDWWTGDCRVVWNPIEKICRLGPYSAPHPSLSSLVIERFLSAPRHLGKKPSFSWQTFYKEFRSKLEKNQEFQKVSIPQYAISSCLCFGCFLTPPDFIWFPDAKSWVRKWWLQRVSEDTTVRQQAPQLRSCWCVQGRQWGLGGWMHSQAATVQVFRLFQKQPSRVFVMSISIFVLDSFPRCMLVQALNNYRR